MAHDPRPPAVLPLAVILAGGRARRMGGGDKALLPLAGRPLLDHVLARIAPQVRAVALNANGDPARFAAWNLPVLPDPLADPLAGHLGPLAGLLAGMLWARTAFPDATDLLSVPADTPFLPPDLVARLQAARRNGARIAVAVSGGQAHPVVTLWPVDLADDLAAALAAGTRKVRAFAAPFGPAEAVFAAPFDTTEAGDPFFNVNTPDDLAQAALPPLASGSDPPARPEEAP